jgi:hypothetical protein
MRHRHRDYYLNFYSSPLSKALSNTLKETQRRAPSETHGNCTVEIACLITPVLSPKAWAAWGIDTNLVGLS